MKAPPTISAAAADPFLATRTLGLILVGLLTVLIALQYVPALHRND